MRTRLRLSPVLLAAGLIGGCAGHVADFIGPRSSIVSPQLIRYGFTLRETHCVSGLLGTSLTPLQLRLLTRSAGALKQGYSDPARLQPSDLERIAQGMRGPKVAQQLTAASQACNVGSEAAEAARAAAAAGTAAEPATAGQRPSAWLNLGAAGTGQSIAVDAGSIEQEGATRTAWFRLTNPGGAASTGIDYHLKIDCAARTIGSLGQRNAAGEYRASAPPDSNPMPAEGGTVMEIAWLALCT
jgi:hypothetical protein